MTRNFFVCALLFFSFLKIQAQGGGADSLSIKTGSTLDEIIISANKIEESRAIISQQIQVIKNEDIQRLQAQTTADVLSAENIFVQKSQQGGGSPILRGFEANKVLLVMDGVRLNNIIYRAGHLQNIITLDNAALDKIEVLFGPASSVYGSDALGGVVHIITKKPTFLTESGKLFFNTNFSTRYGSVNNEVTPHLDFNIGGKKLASFTSFTYSQFGDLQSGSNKNPFYNDLYGQRFFYVKRIHNRDSSITNNNVFLQKQSGYWQYNLLQKFLYAQNNFITHGLTVHFTNSSNVPRYDRLTESTNGTPTYSEWYYGPQKLLLTSYDVNISNIGRFSDNIHLGINYQNVEESRHTRRFRSDNISRRTEKVQVIGGNFDIQNKRTHWHNRLGIDFQYNTLLSTAVKENIINGQQGSLDTRYPNGDNFSLSSSLYFSGTYFFTKKWIGNYGFRLGYSNLQSTFADKTFFPFPYNDIQQKNVLYSGSLGIVYLPDNTWKFLGTLSTGYRVPNVDDISKVFESTTGTSETRGTLIVPNPNLKPEKTINVELGITKVILRTISWENILYYTLIQDAIVTDAFTFNGQSEVVYGGGTSKVFANQNKSRGYITGFQSSLYGKITKYLGIKVAFNTTYGRTEDAGTTIPLDHIPPMMWKGEIHYSHKRLYVSFWVLYNGWKQRIDYRLNAEDNEQYAPPEGMPAWYTLNMRASYNIKNYRFTTGIDNIVDTQYRTFASGINAPGRNIFVSIAFHF
ncbi:MAG: TonB-dependent receptor [Chitinophagaceae bacterium]|nr:TonB-dependent receptor [Chitinophagaceae bacterium]